MPSPTVPTVSRRFRVRADMPELKVKGVTIVETFAEAFPMVGTRVIITAPTLEWAMISARTMTGFATSVIACGAEGGIERTLSRKETPDGRPGVAVLLFTMNADKLQTQLRNRVGQCVLTSPGSACFAGLEGEKSLKLGSSLRFFGDGWQMSKVLGGKRYWRIPVMDGEFVCEDKTGMTKKAVGGGNLLVLGKTHAAVLAACTRAVKAKDAQNIHFVCTDDLCDKIGAILAGGAIFVDGDAGAFLGAQMKSGKIGVTGSAGVLAAASMAGGEITMRRRPCWQRRARPH